MGATKVLTDNFSLGRVSDVPPNRMKPNMAVEMLNFVPDYLNASLALRPAWEYSYIAQPDFTTFSASTTSVSGSNYAPFQDGGKVVFVDQAGRILSLSTSGTGSLLDATGLATTQGGAGIFHLDRLILPVADGAHFPWYVSSNGSGTASATAFADPFPKARIGTSWGAYLLMANGGDFANSYADNQRRLWFSDPGLFTFTAANNSYWDFPKMERIVAVGTSANAILVFGPRHFEVLTGTTPPPNNDLVWRDGYSYGVCDPNAIKKWNGYFIFANERGVFKTDGTSIVNLTERVGLNNAWTADMQQFSTGWTCALGIYQDYAIVTVMNSGPAEQFTYVFDLGKEIGFNFSGFPTRMYAEIAAGPHASVVNSEQDLVFGLSNLAQAGRMQPVFSPGARAGADANGVVIPFNLETSLYMLGSMGDKRIRRTYVSYAWGLGSPYNENISFYYNINNNPFGVPTWQALNTPPNNFGRQPLFVNARGRWISYKIQGGLGVGTRNFALFGLEVEGHAIEPSRTQTT